MSDKYQKANIEGPKNNIFIEIEEEMLEHWKTNDTHAKRKKKNEIKKPIKPIIVKIRRRVAFGSLKPLSKISLALPMIISSSPNSGTRLTLIDEPATFRL